MSVELCMSHVPSLLVVFCLVAIPLKNSALFVTPLSNTLIPLLARDSSPLT
jgi:hypothetical protein